MQCRTLRRHMRCRRAGTQSGQSGLNSLITPDFTGNPYGVSYKRAVFKKSHRAKICTICIVSNICVKSQTVSNVYFKMISAYILDIQTAKYSVVGLLTWILSTYEFLAS